VSGLLVVNAGSSSVKFAVFDGRDQAQSRTMHGQIEGIGQRPQAVAFDGDGTPIDADELGGERVADHRDALTQILGIVERHAELDIRAAGHRVVHGGSAFTAPVRLDRDVVRRLHAYDPLAPLHQPHNLAAVEALMSLRPDLPQVACFDTAFHACQSAVAQAFALPRALTAEGVRRYGFHGLSYEYVAGRMPEHLGTVADGRVVVAHLGNGASMCAMRSRASVASTMGFSALDGLVMGTRCGNVDPAVPLYLMQHRGMTADEVSDLFYRRSGLLGVSGISSDMRVLLDSDTAEAGEAIELFVYRVTRELGSLAAALGGLDALVFTAGIGEHAAPIRQRICADAAWLGIEIDPTRNASHGPRIDRPGSRVAVLVIPTDEEATIARHTRALVGR